MTAQRFATGLQQLEVTGDLEAFVSLFSGEVELLRPEQDTAERGHEGAVRFWRTYLGQFQEVRSSFARLVDAERLSELEWSSEGTLHTGRPIAYRGCSLLEHDDQGKVLRFATYYDTAAFSAPLR